MRGPPIPKPARKLVTRADGRELVRTTVYLKPELAKRLAVVAAVKERTQSDIMSAALRAHLPRLER